MADLLDFPLHIADSEAPPHPGDPYRAYARWQTYQTPTIAFHYGDSLMTAVAYKHLAQMDFDLPGGGDDVDGDAVMTLYFDVRRKREAVVITGCNLYRLYGEIGFHRVCWLWAKPEGKAVAAGSPVIHSIRFRDATGD